MIKKTPTFPFNRWPFELISNLVLSFFAENKNKFPENNIKTAKVHQLSHKIQQGIL